MLYFDKIYSARSYKFSASRATDDDDTPRSRKSEYRGRTRHLRKVGTARTPSSSSPQQCPIPHTKSSASSAEDACVVVGSAYQHINEVLFLPTPSPQPFPALRCCTRAVESAQGPYIRESAPLVKAQRVLTILHRADPTGSQYRLETSPPPPHPPPRLRPQPNRDVCAGAEDGHDIHPPSLLPFVGVFEVYVLVSDDDKTRPMRLAALAAVPAYDVAVKGAGAGVTWLVPASSTAFSSGSAAGRWTLQKCGVDVDRSW
ncbi:hypothetical protein C8J57DRAFT_1513740 [Mycena rebaudengoi]|nr:hypothetical protein C8J57DRAFT_1513740 [Mycena rebaudengoi]